jgi:hypothetical protein
VACWRHWHTVSSGCRRSSLINGHNNRTEMTNVVEYI